MLSQTEENYLKAIYHRSEYGRKEVSTNSIAESLKTKPASVTDMMKKLADKQLIHYVKYKGVSLTDEGNQEALKIIRKHRLWEVFLVKKLGFQWDEVHDIAEQLEHIKSPQLIQRLDKFLGHPEVDPHGDPIPNEAGKFTDPNYKLLSELSIGSSGTILGVKDSSSVFLKHLDKLGISLGVSIKILNIEEYDHSIEVEINGKDKATLSKVVSQNIFFSA